MAIAALVFGIVALVVSVVFNILQYGWLKRERAKENVEQRVELPKNPDRESLKYVAEIALHEEQELAGRANWLDTKTGVVLGFVIVSVAELLGFLFLASGEKAKLPTAHLCLFATFFFVGLGALVAASFAGLIELAPMGFKYGASTELLAPHVDKPVEEVQMLCIDSLRSSAANNRGITARKAMLTKATVLLVAVALLCYSLAVGILFLSLF